MGKGNHLLNEMSGMDREIVDKLNKQEISTTDELLDMCITRNDRDILSNVLGIRVDELLVMANICDLLRIETITPGWAWLLEKVGVDTIPELAQRKKEHLLLAIKKYDIVFSDVVMEKPDEKIVGEWIETAKKMERKLKY